MKAWSVLGSVLLISTVVTARQSGLTSAQIEKPAATSWPTFNGDYSGRRHSALAKINASNVKHLSVAWIYDLPTERREREGDAASGGWRALLLDAGPRLRGGSADRA